MTDWAVGMRCVCVKNHDLAPTFPDSAVEVVGRVYTVRRVGICSVTAQVLLWLEEIDNRHLVGRHCIMGGRIMKVAGEPGLSAELFRPLSETRLDQFRQHLAPAPRETEDA